MRNIISLFKKEYNIEKFISKTKGLQYSLFCNGITPHHGALIASTLYEENNDYMLVLLYKL